jgi:hypothetical protein
MQNHGHRTCAPPFDNAEVVAEQTDGIDEAKPRDYR